MDTQRTATASNGDHPEILAFSPKRAAVASSLPLRTITAAIASGALPSFKKGRRRLILRADLEGFLRPDPPRGLSAIEGEASSPIGNNNHQPDRAIETTSRSSHRQAEETGPRQGDYRV